MFKKIRSVWQRLMFCMAEARVLYGGGSCSVWRRLVYCMAVREAQLFMAEVHFCMAEALGGWGFPRSLKNSAVEFRYYRTKQ